MTCPRCQGLMLVEVVHPHVRSWPLHLWRCVQCGNRLDYLIARHQREAKELKDWKRQVWEEVKLLVRLQGAAQP